MLLDASWEIEAIKVAGNYNSEEYLMGVEAFQQKAIKDLEYKIIVSEETLRKYPEKKWLYEERIEGLKESIEIIKNLKK